MEPAVHNGFVNSMNVMHCGIDLTVVESTSDSKLVIQQNVFVATYLAYIEFIFFLYFYTVGVHSDILCYTS